MRERSNVIEWPKQEEKDNSSEYSGKYLADAEVLMEKRDYANAIENLELALEADPENKEALSSLGFCYFETEEFKKAAQYYEKYIELDAGDFNAYYNLAMCELMLKQPEKAKSNFLQSLKLNPNHMVASYELGELLYSEGNYFEAYKFLKKVGRDTSYFRQAKELLDIISKKIDAKKDN